jgi:hypothetical protein
MLPLILLAAGAYIIGEAVFEDDKYAEGGEIYVPERIKIGTMSKQLDLIINPKILEGKQLFLEERQELFDSINNDTIPMEEIDKKLFDFFYYWLNPNEYSFSSNELNSANEDGFKFYAFMGGENLLKTMGRKMNYEQAMDFAKKLVDADESMHIIIAPSVTENSNYTLERYNQYLKDLRMINDPMQHPKLNWDSWGVYVDKTLPEPFYSGKYYADGGMMHKF